MTAVSQLIILTTLRNAMYFESPQNGSLRSLAERYFLAGIFCCCLFVSLKKLTEHAEGGKTSMKKQSETEENSRLPH